jgi:hypothetical protein
MQSETVRLGTFLSGKGYWLTRTQWWGLAVSALGLSIIDIVAPPDMVGSWSSVFFVASLMIILLILCVITLDYVLMCTMAFYRFLARN